MGKFFGDLFDDLKLYARQIAWWNAPRKRVEKVGKTEREIELPKRAVAAGDKGDLLYFPPLAQEARYLLEHLQSLGYVQPGMGGPMRLTHQEICAWSELHGVALWSWEVTALREMSGEFASELIAAESEKRPPPWSPSPDQVDQVELVARIKNVLRR